MKSIMSSPIFGYYSKDENRIGSSGDFITSPEISQIFGEVIACWFATKMKSDEKYVILELGPGKGTLLNDVLGTLKKIRSLQNISRIELLECSSPLKKLQVDAIKKFELNYSHIESLSTRIYKEENVLIIANEFFDAQPVHIFKKDFERNIWKEVLVDYDSGFKFVCSPNSTVAAKLLEVDRMFPNGRRSIELSPISWQYSRDLARIGKDAKKCIGLIFDYGQWGPSEGSLRAIHDHRILESPLEMVGDADLSADVDFYAIHFYLQSHFHCFFTTQKNFLVSNCVQNRAQSLISSNPLSTSKINEDVNRLVNFMGIPYKVLCFESFRPERPSIH
jgi:NADH dehydrogenase [ubiquinone] 1 alpha subcomplex assembly factor 7